MPVKSWLLVTVLALLALAGGVHAAEPDTTSVAAEPDTTTAAVEAIAPTTDNLDSYAGQTVTNITIQGNNVTKEYVIARQIWTDVGDALDPDLVRDDVTRLKNISIFGSVEVTVTPVEGGVVLNFSFTELPWLIPYPALSYTEQNGFSIGLGISSPNFLGRNMTLGASAVFGGTITYNVNAANPWITGNHVSANFKAYHKTRYNDLLEYNETSDLVQIGGGTYLGVNGRFDALLAYYGVASDEDNITLNPSNRDNMYGGNVSVGLDTRDSWLMPRDGWRNKLTTGYIGGDANFMVLNVDVRRFVPVGQKNAFATGPLFSFQSGTVGEDVPSYMQYFLGGANTIRGYKLSELGKELFGKNQFLYTLEYRYTLLAPRAFSVFKWSVGMGFELAAFGDVGVAWSRSQDFSLNRTRYGYGVGFRVLLPAIEMVRFDIGISQYGDVVFNFGMNSIFQARTLRIR